MTAAEVEGVLVACDSPGCDARATVARVPELPLDQHVPSGWLRVSLAPPLQGDEGPSRVFSSAACAVAWADGLSVSIKGKGTTLTTLGAVLDDPPRIQRVADGQGDEPTPQEGRAGA